MALPRASIVLPLLIVLAGTAGWMQLRARPAPPPASLQIDATSNWFLRSAGDDSPRYGRPPDSGPGVELQPGTTFRLTDEDYELQRYATLGFKLKTPAADTLIELALRETPEAATVLEFVPGSSMPARAVLRRTGAEDVVLAESSPAGPPPSRGNSLQLALRIDGSHYAAALDGQRLLEWDAPGLKHGYVSLRVQHGALRVQQLNATGRQTNQHGAWRDFSLSEILTDPAPAPTGPVHLESLLLALTAAAAAAWLLRALCVTRPAPGDLAAATLLLLAGPALPLALSAIRPVPSLVWVCLILAVLMLPLALVPVSSALRGFTQQGRVSIWLSLGLAFAIATGTAVLCGRHSAAALVPVIEREQVAQETPLAPDWTAATAALDAGNALEVPQLRRDMLVTATVLLEPDSALAVRLRAPERQIARGILFTLSGSPSLRTGFRLEDFTRFDEMAETDAAVPTDHPCQLALEVRGTTYVARLDDRELVRIEDRSYAAGSVLFLAQRGSVRLRDVKVVSLEADTRLPSMLEAQLSGALLPLAALLWALCASLLLRQPVRVACGVGACALLPLALAFVLVPRNNFTSDTVLFAGSCAAAVLGVHALVHGPRSRRPVLTTLALLLLAVGTWAVALPHAIDERALVDGSDLNRMSYADWTGDRLDADLLSLQHPLLRRWNDWLARHRFRERIVSLQRRQGVPRVMTLGGSSTWGYRIPPDSGADWPAQLERLLQPQIPVEVVNAGFVGATSNRLYHFFRESLLPFAPDVVVLCVSFNDSTAQAQGDEEAYLSALTEPGRRRSWIDDCFARKERDNEREALTRVFEALPRDSRSTLELWREVGMTSSPPMRFERALRQFAELCKERGIRLVLVKEPVASGARMAWKEEFCAAIDAVGADFSLPIVDPTEALVAAGDRDLFMDRVHLKPSGCAVVAAEVARAVTPLLASR